MDRGRAALVWIAIEFHRSALLAHGRDRDVDEVAGGYVNWREPFHSADIPGILSGQLHESLRISSHREIGFSAVAAGEHTICSLAPPSGSRRICGRVFRVSGDGLCRASDSPHANIFADGWISDAMRGWNIDSLLADVFTREH